MKRREWVFLRKKDEDRLMMIYQPMTWREAREFMRKGWGLVNMNDREGEEADV